MTPDDEKAASDKIAKAVEAYTRLAKLLGIPDEEIAKRLEIMEKDKKELLEGRSEPQNRPDRS